MIAEVGIDTELAALESANLHYLIPSFLFDYFKIELNDRILKDIINEFDHLLHSTDTNNSFKIMSLNEKSSKNVLNDSNESVSSALFLLNKYSKAFILEIGTRLVEIFEKYNSNLMSVFEVIERENRKLTGLVKTSIISRSQLISFQRSILVQKLSSKHYDLLNLLFRHAFDYYNVTNKVGNDDDDDDDESGNEDDEEDQMDNDSSSSNNLISKFHELNKIL